MKERINRQIALNDLLSRFPTKSQKITDELALAGLDCSDTCVSAERSLESSLKESGMNDREIDETIQRLNEIADEPDCSATINLTEKAAEQFRSILTDEKKTGWNLRFGVNGAGCCGSEYFLDYSQKAEPSDAVFESHGIQIHVDQKSLNQLLGCTIDYIDGRHGEGFKIIHPFAGCSCHKGSNGCC